MRRPGLAVGGIGEAAVEPSIEFLELIAQAPERSDDTKYNTMTWAMETIGPPAVPALCDRLMSSEQAAMRRFAARALFRIRDDMLLMRQKVYIALGGIGSARAVGPLLEAMQREAEGDRQRSHENQMREHIARALVAIGQPALPALMERIASDDFTDRPAVAQVMLLRIVQEIAGETFYDRRDLCLAWWRRIAAPD